MSLSGLLDGKYEILRRLGSGGMGEVYLVRHLHLQQLRVLKVLRADLAADEGAAQRFHQEARTAIQIKHPNVAILYDYSQLPDGRFYMIWEHIEGEDIGARIRSRGPLPPALAVELGVQALRGLDAIHSGGVIHRDISPDNLMLTTDRKDREIVKIIDLGLAKDLGSNLELTQAGTFLGKLQYCSPEQAGYRRGEALDARSDLYSFSLVLYEMLSGLPPFESESQHGYVLKRLSEEPIPLSERLGSAGLPSGLEQVVMRGLARDRENRFHDAIEYIKALVEVGHSLGRDDSRGFAVPPAAVVPVAPRPAAPASTVPTVKPAPKKSSELSMDERLQLLAQIDEAARRVKETSKVHTDAEIALREGRFEEAREHVRRLEAANPRMQGLTELKARLAEHEQVAKRREQVRQAEQMLEKYLLEKQQTLAALALETLLEIYPNHPKRGDYEAWVKLLGDEAQQAKRAEDAMSQGRRSLARNDLEGARRALQELEKCDPAGKMSAALLAEIREAEHQEAAATTGEARRQELDRALESGDAAAAEQALAALESLSTVPRVTIASYRRRLDELQSQVAAQSAERSFEVRFRERVRAQDFGGAREVALELERLAPKSGKPAAMFAEVSRAEEASRRRQSVVVGLAQLEAFLEAGQIQQAEVAVKILTQLDPDRVELQDARRRLEELKRRR